jgi:aryl-alcohol dehydrogenase-like predicted oxidoreductase
MEYRKLPRGGENERFGVLGLGMGGIGQTPADEIEAIVKKAIANGINFFDLCTAGASYAPIGRAIKGRRDKVFLQMHFGAVYDENGEYGWCRDFETIKKPFGGSLKHSARTTPISAFYIALTMTRILKSSAK